MAATVQIVEKNGTGADQTNKASGTVRFKTADDATVDSSDPITIPDSGFNFSYEKYLRLDITVAPDTQITNPVLYSDGGAFSTNVWVGVQTNTYAAPALGTATDGYTDLFTYVSTASLVLGAGTYTGTGEFGEHAKMLMRVASTASPGSLTAETLTFAYDEI